MVKKKYFKLKDFPNLNLVSPGEAANLVKSGFRIIMSANANTPTTFLNSLFRRAHELEDVEIIHMRLLGNLPQVTINSAKQIRFNPIVVSKDLRDGFSRGLVDHTPSHFHQVSQIFSKGYRDLDLAVIALAAPSEDCTSSYGTYIGFMDTVSKIAKQVIVEVNLEMPQTFGSVRFPLKEAVAILESSHSLPEESRPIISEVERKMGENVASLIKNGDCLQVGAGGATSAVAEFLSSHRDLGVHTELFTDWMMDLVQKNCINNSKKKIHRNETVASFCRGTKKLYDFIHENPMIQFYPIEHTNDPFVIGQIDNFVAINGAVQVDLQGQVNSESLGFLQISGTGGLLDFVRGASHSSGGRNIVVFPSTALGGKVSRILPFFEPGTAVTIPRSDVEWIVTEYGSRNLKGLSLRERSSALIEIAHPSFRDELTFIAKEGKLSS